ncbi:MAG: LuxR C-terminal-related transcriptional regulator [Anaerolineales bacterium]
MESGLPGSSDFQINDLTWREQEILLLLAEHNTNREIGEQLHLAESTVKDYVSKILGKLYVKNRRQAVVRAKELGLLEVQSEKSAASLVNIPAEPTPFVGRRFELAEIQSLLGETRLLTLIGPGGIGKTRLAIRAARQSSSEYTDGVYFVPLAPISSPDRLVQTIAETVKFPLMTQEDPQAQLLRFLQNKHMLLVMDNFEHLLDGLQIVSEILPRAPEVKILATSREKLNLFSETIFIVGGMNFTLPERSPSESRNDASALFIQSANKVYPGFDPSHEELQQIESICQMVEGTPLAIELAAAWLQILNLDEISTELKQGFDLLSTEARDAPERHRSLRAVFNHSWNLLDTKDRKTLMHLSIFRGGFTRLAAQQVAKATTKQLMNLVNKSFLTHDPNTSRLNFHELLREYAEQRLVESEQARRSIEQSHAVYFADFMLERWSQLQDHRQPQALDEIEADIENVRIAWSYWLEQNNSLQLMKFSKTIWLSHWIRGWHLAGSHLFQQAARQLGDSHISADLAMRAFAMACQGYFMTWLDISEVGYELTRQGVNILSQFDYPEELIIALDSLTVNAYFLGRISEVVTIANQMLVLARQFGDKWMIQFSLYAASLAAILEENIPRAQQMAQEQLQICEQIGDEVSSTYPLITLGHTAFIAGEYEQAAQYYRRCMKISRQIGFNYSLQTSSKYLGKAEIFLGHLVEAQQALLKCLELTHDIGFVRDMVNLFYEFARLKLARGELQQAVELLAFVEQHPYSDNFRLMEGRIRDSARDLLDELEGDVSETNFQSALEAGRNLELDQIYKRLVN